MCKQSLRVILSFISQVHYSCTGYTSYTSIFARLENNILYLRNSFSIPFFFCFFRARRDVSASRKYGYKLRAGCAYGQAPKTYGPIIFAFELLCSERMTYYIPAKHQRRYIRINESTVLYWIIFSRLDSNFKYVAFIMTNML